MQLPMKWGLGRSGLDTVLSALSILECSPRLLPLHQKKKPPVHFFIHKLHTHPTGLEPQPHPPSRYYGRSAIRAKAHCDVERSKRYLFQFSVI